MEKITISDKARVCVTKDMNDPKMAKLLGMIADYDKITYIHSQNVAYLTSQILIMTKIDKRIARQIVRGALLHDIGKVMIDKRILNKTEVLTAEEYALIKQHPQFGVDLVNEMAPELLTDITKDIILHHHENKNGDGYPERLKQLNPFTELVAMIDRYDAMTSERCYGSRYPSIYTIDYLSESCECQDFLKCLRQCENK